MKRIPNIILFLTLFSFFLLSACNRQTSTTPTANHLVEFNKDGIAVIRGHLLSGGFDIDTSMELNESLEITIPAEVDGIEASVVISFPLRFETEISSSLTPKTNVRDYHDANPFSTASSAFPNKALVDITFLKEDAMFETIAIHEITQDDASQSIAVIDGVFSTNLFSKGTLRGRVKDLKQDEASVIWMVSITIDIQGVEATVLLPIHCTPDTQIISNGDVPLTLVNPWGNVQIQFTRKGDTLTAHQVTEIP